MIQGKQKIELNKESILSKVDDYNIIRHYLGQDFDYKRKFSSPLRQKGSDNTPNLCFFPGDNGQVLFKDFANGVGGDCFKFVQLMYGINYNQALHKIDQDFGLGIVSTPKFKIQLTKKPDSIHKQAKIIQIEERPFTNTELGFWNDYHITLQELEDNNVLAFDRCWINKQLLPRRRTELRFAYLYDDYLKLYSPFSELKWISNCPNDFISGFDNIKWNVYKGDQDNKLIIAKAKKDEIVWKKFMKDVCSTQNESSAAITDEDGSYILRYYKPENVYVAYDNDEPGIKASQLLCDKWGFNSIVVPQVYRREGIKDWSDLVKEKDLKTMENILKIKKLI